MSLTPAQKTLFAKMPSDWKTMSQIGELNHRPYSALLGKGLIQRKKESGITYWRKK